MPLIFTSMSKAIRSLEEAIQYAKQTSSGMEKNIIRDSVIQRFKYSFEICWKMIQRWIRTNLSPEDAEPRSKKDLFRLAAKSGLISDPNLWFEFNEARNMTTHTYDEEYANRVYHAALEFCDEAKFLLQQLEKSNDCS